MPKQSPSLGVSRPPDILAGTDDKHIRRYELIAAAIHFYLDCREQQPDLADVARKFNVTKDYIQRAFSELVGLSPTQFLQFLNGREARAHLARSSVLASSEALGLSSQSRLYDVMVKCEGITPGEYRSGGVGLTIEYGLAWSPFGWCFAGITERGICKLSFLDNEGGVYKEVEALKSEWPNARLNGNNGLVSSTIEEIFYSENSGNSSGATLRVLVKGTPFQIQVWQALLHIPRGYCWAYTDVATYLGKKTAVRAVASAIARNPIAYLIPCHRVIRQSGAINQYRWGIERKALMLAKELSISPS